MGLYFEIVYCEQGDGSCIPYTKRLHALNLKDARREAGGLIRKDPDQRIKVCPKCRTGPTVRRVEEFPLTYVIESSVNGQEVEPLKI